MFFPSGNAEEFCDHVFRTFDMDKNGYIDFKVSQHFFISSLLYDFISITKISLLYTYHDDCCWCCCVERSRMPMGYFVSFEWGFGRRMGLLIDGWKDEFLITISAEYYINLVWFIARVWMLEWGMGDAVGHRELHLYWVLT